MATITTEKVERMQIALDEDEVKRILLDHLKRMGLAKVNARVIRIDMDERQCELMLCTESGDISEEKMDV